MLPVQGQFCIEVSIYDSFLCPTKVLGAVIKITK